MDSNEVAATFADTPLVMPHQTLPAFESTNTDTLPGLCAGLIFHDVVRVGGIGWPGEELILATDRLTEEMKKVAERVGDEFYQDDYIDLENGSFLTDALTVEDALIMAHSKWRFRLNFFWPDYRELFEAGVIKTASLSHTHGVEHAQQILKSTTDAWLDIFPALLFDSRESNRRLLEITGGYYSDCFSINIWMRDYLREYRPAILDSKTLNAKMWVFELTALVFASTQEWLSGIYGEPTLTVNNRYDASLDVMWKAVPDLKRQSPLRKKGGTDVDLAVPILASSLQSLPALIPKSAQALLALRDNLSSDLGEFREALATLSSELTFARPNGASEADIRYFADQKLVRPLNSLRKRLAHPNKEILDNLVNSSGVIGAAVGFTIAAGSGLDQISSAMGGLAGNLLAAAIKTKLDRKKAVNESPVRFMWRALESVQAG